MSRVKASDKELEGAGCCTAHGRPTEQGARAGADPHYCNALVTWGSERVISRCWLVAAT